MGRIIKKHEIDPARMTRHPHTEQALRELLGARAHAVRLRRETRTQVIDLAFAIAQRFTGAQIARSDTLLDDLYRQTLSSLPERSSGVIAVTPVDRARSAIEQLAAHVDLRVVDDPALAPGECRVTVDEQLSIEATFAALRRAIEIHVEEIEP